MASQVVLGALCAGVAWVLAGSAAGRSALYGATVVVVAGALMARGATHPLAVAVPMAGAIGLLGYAIVKIVAVLAMLTLATRILPDLVWEALLATAAVCLQTYWLALAVRRQGKAG